MNRRKPYKTFFITAMMAALALTVALAPLSEAGRLSGKQTNHSAKAKSPSPWRRESSSNSSFRHGLR